MTYTLKLPARWEIRHPNPGVRHDRTVRVVPHRFPVKGGVTWREVRRLFPEQAVGFRGA